MSIFNKIKLVCFDVDGTLTDGIYQISVTQKGESIVSKSFHTRDFSGIEQLLRHDINVLIMTNSDDDVILKRVHGLLYYSDFWTEEYRYNRLMLLRAVIDKRSRLTDLLLDKGMGWDNLAYMGDAENDFECLKLAALSGCPADAIDEVKNLAMYPSDFNGGKGAVYDFCKYILKNKDKQ